MQKPKIYKIESSPFYRLRNKRKLAELLGVDLKNLNKMKTDDFYKVYKIPQGNKEREIQEPKKQLKRVQKKIKKLLQRVETPDWLISGKKGNSFVNNAEKHLGSRNMLTVDIKSFYQNSKKEYVFKFFKSTMRMSEDVAWLISDLVTYRGCIPTGSPSSQIVAYFAYSRSFERIKKIADDHHCLLSLYVDDLTFSSKKPISKQMPYLIDQDLKKVFHHLKTKKTRFLYPSQYKIITGCCITPNGRELKVPNKMRLKVKQEEKACLKNKSRLKDRLFGLILSSRQIELDIYQAKYNYLRKNIKA